MAGYSERERETMRLTGRRNIIFGPAPSEPEGPYANEHGEDFDHEPHCPCRPDHTCCLCDRWQAIQEYRHG